MEISCFADCGSKSLVLRMPYDLAVELLKNLPDSKRKNELKEKMEWASRRSHEFAELLNKI